MDIWEIFSFRTFVKCRGKQINFAIFLRNYCYIRPEIQTFWIQFSYFQVEIILHLVSPGYCNYINEPHTRKTLQPQRKPSERASITPVKQFKITVWRFPWTKLTLSPEFRAGGWSTGARTQSARLRSTVSRASLGIYRSRTHIKTRGAPRGMQLEIKGRKPTPNPPIPEFFRFVHGLCKSERILRSWKRWVPSTCRDFFQRRLQVDRIYRMHLTVRNSRLIYVCVNVSWAEKMGRLRGCRVVSVVRCMKRVSWITLQWSFAQNLHCVNIFGFCDELLRLVAAFRWSLHNCR